MSSTTPLASEVVDAFFRARSRPLVLCGRARTGKATLLREAARTTGQQVVWRSALEMADEVAEALWRRTYDSYSSTVAGDSRPLCIDHLEDLQRRPRTREALRRLLGKAAQRRPVLMTVTISEGEAGLLDWLGSWAELRPAGLTSAGSRRDLLLHRDAHLHFGGGHHVALEDLHRGRTGM